MLTAAAGVEVGDGLAPRDFDFVAAGVGGRIVDPGQNGRRDDEKQENEERSQFHGMSSIGKAYRCIFCASPRCSGARFSGSASPRACAGCFRCGKDRPAMF